MAESKTYEVEDWDVLRSTLSGGALCRLDDYLKKASAMPEGEVFWDNEHNEDSKMGKLSPWWPPMLTHGLVVSKELQRAAVPNEFLGPLGVDACTTGRVSHLVGVVQSMSSRDAIARCGNAFNVRLFMKWMAFVFSNCIRREQGSLARALAQVLVDGDEEAASLGDDSRRSDDLQGWFSEDVMAAETPSTTPPKKVQRSMSISPAKTTAEFVSDDWRLTSLTVWGLVSFNQGGSSAIKVSRGACLAAIIVFVKMFAFVHVQFLLQS